MTGILKTLQGVRERDSLARGTSPGARLADRRSGAGISSFFFPSRSRELHYSFTTHLLLNGVDTWQIQECVRHPNVDTTRIYTHVVKELHVPSFASSQGPTALNVTVPGLVGMALRPAKGHCRMRLLLGGGPDGRTIHLR